jgi:hypothetical protein
VAGKPADGQTAPQGNPTAAAMMVEEKAHRQGQSDNLREFSRRQRGLDISPETLRRQQKSL